MAGWRHLIVSLAALVPVACTTPDVGQNVPSEAAGTSNFDLTAPAAYKTPRGLRLIGRACRRHGSSALSPQGVRLEQVSRTGEVLHIASVYLPNLSRQFDQPCSSYYAQIGWTLEEGESIRACFDDRKACAVTPPTASISKP